MKPRAPKPPAGPRRTPKPKRHAAAHGAPEDAKFLADYDASIFERPSVAVDVVVLAVENEHLVALCVQRDAPPWRGRYALPGGFCGISEGLEAAARRLLADKAHLRGVFLEQLYTFGTPGRDPRTRVISVAHYALVDAPRLRKAAHGSGVKVARVIVPWEGETGGAVELRDDEDKPLALAFDHAEIVGMAVRRLRGKLDYTPVGFQLLPDEFTLRQLQQVHETVLAQPLNKDSFRRRMLASGQLEATGDHQQEVEHRPAELYRFTRRSAT